MANASIFAAFERMWQHVVASLSDVVKATEQSLTDEQQAQARANIGAAAATEAGSGASAAIIDVTELPTENINEDAFYRLLSGRIIYNGIPVSGWTGYGVSALPETGQPVMTTGIVYYNQQDGDVYGYMSDEDASQFGFPGGWYTLTMMAQVMGMSYGGVVTTVKGTEADTNYFLLEYTLYSYKDGWSTVDGGVGTPGTGECAEIFNYGNTASGDYSHAEGRNTTASGDASHAEGNNTEASGYNSHAEGQGTAASGESSHAEGCVTVASGRMAHAEGNTTIATGFTSHAEGSGSYVNATVSYDLDSSTFRIIESNYHISYEDNGSCIVIDSISYASPFHLINETDQTFMPSIGIPSSVPVLGVEFEARIYISGIASGDNSHVEGRGTIATFECQHVQGRYNIKDAVGYAHIVGNGEDEIHRSNAHTIDWSGNGWFAGSVECTELILKSPTEGSLMRYRITVDDSGNLKVTGFI